MPHPSDTGTEIKGPRCLDAYLEWVACFAEISCTEYLDFVSDSGGDACMLEFRTLNRECPGFEFEFRE